MSNVEFHWHCRAEDCETSVATSKLTQEQINRVKAGPIKCKVCGKESRWEEVVHYTVPKLPEPIVEDPGKDYNPDQWIEKTNTTSYTTESSGQPDENQHD